MKIVFCGSMAFAAKMLELKDGVENLGHRAVLPDTAAAHAAGRVSMENKEEKIVNDSIRKHYEKIRESDAILVLNFDKNGIAGYIGGNSFLEMGFAHVLNKKIFLLNPIPAIGYADEIEAMKPVILNGDLTRITDN